MATMQTEQHIIQLAMERLEEPTVFQLLIAFFPCTMILSSCMVILADAYQARGNHEKEVQSTILATILSVVILISSLLFIAVRQHYTRFEIIRGIMEVILRINIFQLIVCGSFITYVKNSLDYSTYFTWLYVVTIPILILIAIPFVTGVFTIYS